MLSRCAILKLGVSAAISTALRKRVLNCLWELTYRCNARCPMCSYWKAPTTPRGELTLPEIQAGLNKVHSYGCRFINFTGGEPTIRRDLEEIIQSASRLGIWTSMVTNGSLLTRQRLQDLKRAGLDNCVVSLDSLDSSEHDELRGIPGLSAKARECLRWVGEDFLSGHHTGGIMCVVSHSNLHQLAGVVRLAEDLGVYVVFQPYHPNKTGFTTPKPPITRQAVDQLLESSAAPPPCCRPEAICPEWRTSVRVQPGIDARQDTSTSVSTPMGMCIPAWTPRLWAIC